MKPIGDRPRVLGVRVGVNPNSSSLGIDITLMLLGSAGVVAAGFVLSALLRGRALLSRKSPLRDPPT